MNTINSIFDILFNMVDGTTDLRASSGSGSNIMIDNLVGKLSPTMDSQLKDLVNKMFTDAQLINAMNNTLNKNELSNPDTFMILKNSINNKLLTSKCPTLLINGDTMPDATKNLSINMISLLKTTIFTYISNLGNSIQRDNPDLINATPNIKCITDINSNNDPSIGTCIYKMIPLQKWVHVIVSVYNQVIDIYVDGQLGSSCVLKGYPAISNLDVSLTPDGGFSGQISRVAFSNTAMTVSKSQELYYEGPIATDSIFSMIPNWVWYSIVLLIVISIIYSYVM